MVLHTTYVLRVPYNTVVVSCGVVLVFWFWREIVFSVTYVLSVQYSCAVVSVFWLWREIMLKMGTRFYKKILLGYFIIIRYEFNMSPEMEVLLFYNLCRNVPYFYDTFMWPVLAPVSPLTSRFSLIMVVSGFGPYHHQQPDDAPAKCASITPTPWG